MQGEKNLKGMKISLGTNSLAVLITEWGMGMLACVMMMTMAAVVYALGMLHNRIAVV